MITCSRPPSSGSTAIRLHQPLHLAAELAKTWKFTYLYTMRLTMADHCQSPLSSSSEIVAWVFKANCSIMVQNSTVIS